MEGTEYARRKALNAYRKAQESLDNRKREEWLKAARQWDQIAEQHVLLLEDKPTRWQPVANMDNRSRRELERRKPGSGSG